MAEKKTTKSATTKKAAVAKSESATAAKATKTSAKKTAAKESVLYVNAENAGFRAGDVYQVLAASAEALTLAEVAKKANLTEAEAILGLGWLLKEGKVASTEENKIILA